MRKITILMGVGLLFFTSLLWAARYELKFGYAPKGIIITKGEKSTFLKTVITAHKGRMEELYMQKEEMYYLDLIRSIKKNRIESVRRQYEKYVQFTQPMGQKRPIKAYHFLTGTLWRVDRKGTRNIATLIKGKVPKPAFKVVRLDDDADTFCRYLPKGEIRPGQKWSLPLDGIRELMGDDWKRDSKSSFGCRFERQVWYKGMKCAKIHLLQKIDGNHKVGINAKMTMEGYLYYSLEYGFPVHFEMKGMLKMKIKNIAPKGQVATFEGEGPIKTIFSKEYRPPEINGGDEDE